MTPRGDPRLRRGRRRQRLANGRTLHRPPNPTARPTASAATSTATCGAAGAWATRELDGVAIFNPDGKLIGRIDLPERCANLCFGGVKRNRLFMAASTRSTRSMSTRRARREAEPARAVAATAALHCETRCHPSPLEHGPLSLAGRPGGLLAAAGRSAPASVIPVLRARRIGLRSVLSSRHLRELEQRRGRKAMIAHSRHGKSRPETPGASFWPVRSSRSPRPWAAPRARPWGRTTSSTS